VLIEWIYQRIWPFSRLTM